ncbi:DUF1450 domain-containing protein [Fodinisporobacter ferrooxydans]|uniref:DUF1450 domain-containing protein n=1 Tax=Fodinisporobacter ferrooxydans TaxID=2901836 RepID=A0ABY4CS02_9BACL|nr:DUF1450 domain-containing protein [Alicyclobacillaceae bacterium MYW30-H2]
MSQKKRMALFCKRNVEVGGARTVVDLLEREHKDEIEVRIVDCFKRCLACSRTPFCRMQLTTLEAGDGNALIEKIIQTARK